MNIILLIVVFIIWRLGCCPSLGCLCKLCRIPKLKRAVRKPKVRHETEQMEMEVSPKGFETPANAQPVLYGTLPALSLPSLGLNNRFCSDTYSRYTASISLSLSFFISVISKDFQECFFLKSIWFLFEN